MVRALRPLDKLENVGGIWQNQTEKAALPKRGSEGGTLLCRSFGNHVY